MLEFSLLLFTLFSVYFCFEGHDIGFALGISCTYLLFALVRQRGFLIGVFFCGTLGLGIGLRFHITPYYGIPHGNGSFAMKSIIKELTKIATTVETLLRVMCTNPHSN